MDKLKLYAHINYCLRACAEDHKEIWLHQAFGAAQYHLIIHPEDEAEVARRWNERDKPTFERLIYGYSFTL
jgi:hypothetical protein